MKLQKFEAPSMKEALEKIKAELGPDAFILSTKQITKKGPLGIGDRKFLQVTAAIEEDAVAPAAPSQAKPAETPVAAGGLDIKIGEEDWAAAMKEPPSGETYTPTGKTKTAEPPPKEGFDALFNDAARKSSRASRKSGKDDGGKPLRKELDEIKAMVSDLQQAKPDMTPLQRELGELKSLLYNVIRSQAPILGKSLSPELLTWFQRLKNTGMEESVAAKLIQITESKLAEKDQSNGKKIGKFLENAVKQSIEAGQSSKLSGVVALVGPTGVGKTTTLAKLAAHAKLHHGADVALITLDTYRIAAVEQLKTYAKIMEIPVQVALNLNELRGAIKFHGDKDLILIDTAGHSQKDQASMATLQEFLKNQEDIDVHLVLSATTKSTDLTDIVNKFEPLGPEHLIFTKLDETSAYGPLFNQIIRTRKPVSYLTVGQSVPEDFLNATRDILASLFVGKPLADAAGGSS